MITFSSAPSPFNLPAWVERLVQDQKTPLVSAHDRMGLVVQLALSNVEQGIGGPFGAAVFEAQTGALVAVGVNLVTVSNCSHAHAEMVALANAQQQVRSFDLAAPGMPPHELVTSCEPCAMCFGAIPLAGVRRLVCGARSEDAEAFGFDEGAKPKNWATALQEREIAVIRDVCRDEALVVFQEYQKRGGLIYNPRRGR
ncbi:MAG TPA: nucleoside deaminase [Nitrospira sp.]|nr:nucleoside deaminase [Nitrospira sp.]